MILYQNRKKLNNFILRNKILVNNYLTKKDYKIIAKIMQNVIIITKEIKLLLLSFYWYLLRYEVFYSFFIIFEIVMNIFINFYLKKIHLDFNQKYLKKFCLISFIKSYKF